MIETLLRSITIEESGNSYGSHIFLRLLCDRMNHLHTIPISLCLTIVYLSEVLIVGSIPSSTSLPIITLFSFPWYVVPYEPVTCLQANWMTFHREGPEYIYPSYGWTNPTLDPCVSTHTFRTLNATFIATQLRCGV